MENSKQLSETMIKALAYINEHGTIERQPGGYWLRPGGKVVPGGYWVNTQTVKALVSRGLIYPSRFKENSGGRFAVAFRRLYGFNVNVFGEGFMPNDFSEARLKKIEGAPFRYKAYDDDGFFYFGGVVGETEDEQLSLFDFACRCFGCTLVNLYDSKTGKYVDAIG